MTKRLIFIALTFAGLSSNGQQIIDSLRQIASISATTDGKIEWTSSGETVKEPFVIEQFRWNKWIKIGEVDAHVSAGQKLYQFKAIPHNGENLCRVKPTSNSLYSKEVKWTNSLFPKIKFVYNKKASKIEFVDEQSRPTETMYEIIDSSGTIVKKGWYSTVSVDNLPKGKYTLHYDNATTEFKH